MSLFRYLRALGGRLRRRGAAEDGVVLVIVAVLMTAIMASGAYTIDLGSARQAQERAQVAADAGALAAAGDASTNAGGEAADATSVAQLNDPGAAVTFSGSGKVAQVGVSGSSAGVVGGRKSIPVSASASATSSGGENSAAVFGYDSNCSDTGVDIENNGSYTSGGVSYPSYIDGSIDSNSDLIVKGNATTTSSTGSTSSSGGKFYFANASPLTIGSGSTAETVPAFSDALTYGYGSGCTVTSTGNSPTNPSATQRSSAITKWPDDYTAVGTTSPYNLSPTGNHSGCTYYYNGNQTFDGSNSGSLNDSGVYCWNGQVTFQNYTDFNSDSGITIVAQGIVVSNVTNINAPPDINNDLLFDCVGGSSYTCSLNGNLFSGGTIFAPNNLLTISSTKDLTIDGYLEANQVKITANAGLQLVGNGPAVSNNPALTS